MEENWAAHRYVSQKYLQIILQKNLHFIWSSTPWEEERRMVSEVFADFCEEINEMKIFRQRIV